MSALFKRWPPSGDLAREATETIISASTTVAGAVRTGDSIRVDGRVEGPVRAEGTVIVGPDGIIDGDVSAANVHIAGAVHGQVRATFRLELAEGGELYGDVEVARLAIQDGAVFRGQVVMREPDGDTEPPSD
ncbi:MAG: polymer-forming cytoskeletal protein [Chloroflexi bacterium]|nr:polymer-forming cytoskeletal protein [Chloroflexota bacterium]